MHDFSVQPWESPAPSRLANARDGAGLDARLLRGDTLTVAALERISRNRVELVAVVESLQQRGVGIASLAPSESWLHPLGARPTEVEQMMGEIILRVMAWAAQAELESIKRRIEAGVRRAAEEGRFPGRPRELTPDQTAAIRLLRRNGQSQSAVARTFASPARPSGAPSSRSSGQGDPPARWHNCGSGGPLT